MKFISKKVFGIFLILNALIIISNCHEEDRIIRLKELNLSDQETYIPLKSGQKFTIELEGNPTTGYSWFLHTPEKLQESNLLKPLNLKDNNTGDYYSLGNKNNKQEEIERVGTGGIFHFKFIAGKKNGHEKLSFIYKRPWSEEDRIKKSINVKVVNLNDEKDL